LWGSLRLWAQAGDFLTEELECLGRKEIALDGLKQRLLDELALHLQAVRTSM